MQFNAMQQDWKCSINAMQWNALRVDAVYCNTLRYNILHCNVMDFMGVKYKQIVIMEWKM